MEKRQSTFHLKRQVPPNRDEPNPPNRAIKNMTVEDYEKEWQLRRLAPLEQFEDWSRRQRFVKLGQITTAKGQKRQMVLCLWSPIGRKRPGPITGAFFAHIGSVLYL